MRHAAMICAAAASLPMAASAQLEIRHNSNVSVRYQEVPFVGPSVTIEETIEEVSGYEPFSLSHSVSYDDDFLDFDPTASSSFSVESVEFVEFAGSSTTHAYYDVTISGELFRSGTAPSFTQFSGAQSDLTVDFVGFNGSAFVSQYDLTVMYESDVDFSQYSFSNPFLRLLDVQNDGSVIEVYAFQTQGATGSESTSGIAVGGKPFRLHVIADPLLILVQHDGITTVRFEGTFRVLTTLAPEPCLADVNGDGEVTAADFSAWIAAFNANAPECDQNGDETCTPADFSAWIANFNAGC